VPPVWWSLDVLEDSALLGIAGGCLPSGNIDPVLRGKDQQSWTRASDGQRHGDPRPWEPRTLQSSLHRPGPVSCDVVRASRGRKPMASDLVSSDTSAGAACAGGRNHQSPPHRSGASGGTGPSDRAPAFEARTAGSSTRAGAASHPKCATDDLGALRRLLLLEFRSRYTPVQTPVVNRRRHD